MPDWRAIVRQRLGSDASDEVIEEVAEHAEELFRESLSAGRSENESIVIVEAELQNLPVVIRAAREARRRRLPPIEEPVRAGLMRLPRFFVRDLVHGVRLLTIRPAMTLIAVITLALGIGANTAIFSVVHSLLLAPLPFPDPERLVMLWEQDAADPQVTFIVSKPNYDDWAAMSKSFEHTAIWEHQSFNIAGEGDPEQVSGLRISSSAFSLLRVPMQLGRFFTPDEDAPGHDVVVISDSLWRGRYAARPDIVGQLIRLNGRPFQIVGVMPPEFVFYQRRHALWVPIQFTTQDAGRGSHSFYAAARLKPGVDFESARAEMESVGRRLASEHTENRGESATITRMNDFVVVRYKTMLLILMGAVGLVLLIACANVANLLLAQASVRQREFAIRAAMGASRGRLTSQLVAEGIVLALLGGIAGLAVAWLATSAMSGSLPTSVRMAPFRAAAEISVNWPILAFTFIVATTTGVMFSLAPALLLWEGFSHSTLKATGGRGGTGRLSFARNCLVSAEVALSLVVLTAAGLTAKSMSRLISVDPGLDPTNVLVMQMALPQPDTYGPPARTTFCDDVVREISALPGVKSAGAISHLPLSGATAGRGVAIEGRPQPAPGDGASAAYRLTCPGFFKTLGIPILKGRDFTSSDTIQAPQVVIVNELMASTYWPGEDPIGKRIKFGTLESSSPWLTVVGLARNVRHFGLDSDLRREMYRPYGQAVWPVMTITARTSTEPLSMASAVRTALRKIDPEQPVTGVRSMQQVVTDSTGPRRFPMLLLTSFAGIALVLGVIGVYGVVSYIVTQRAREIGIRVALGARSSTVVRLVVGRSLVPIGIGITIGIAGALASSRLLETMLYQVKPSDPMVLLGIAGLLLVAAVLASWLPARRAAGVDPLIVLRQE